MKRLLRILRRVAGAALLAWSAWTILRSSRPRPTFESTHGLDEGRPTGIRIAPLSPAEAATARAVERDFFTGAIDWSQRQAELHHERLLEADRPG